MPVVPRRESSAAYTIVGRPWMVLTERRIRGDEDALLVAVLLQLELRQARVHLDLVDGGDDGAVRKEHREVLDGEVGDADGLDSA